MVCGIPLSAVGISVALIGICINLIFTIPYVGAACCMKEEVVKRKTRWANVGNTLLVVGTVCQLASLFLKK
jgi:hypothetical protein